MLLFNRLSGHPLWSVSFTCSSPEKLIAAILQESEEQERKIRELTLKVGRLQDENATLSDSAQVDEELLSFNHKSSKGAAGKHYSSSVHQMAAGGSSFCQRVGEGDLASSFRFDSG